MAKTKILIVEDNKELLKVLQNTLADRFEVFSATDLNSARDHLNPDLELILSDVRLNEEDSTNLDGLVLLKEVKEKYPEIPVVIMTAFGNMRLQAEARKLGAFDYLPKPLNIDELENVIGKTLEVHSKTKFIKLKKEIRSWLPPMTLFVIVILLWEAIVKLVKVPPYILPAPHQIAIQIKDSAWLLLNDTALTMLEAVLGFFLGSGFGFIIAIGFAHSVTMEKSVYPYMIALRAIPLVAIAPLLILWFGNGILGKVIMASLMCFFPAIVNTTIGLKAINQDALFMMQSISATKWQIFIKLRLPTSLPYFFSALKISSTLAVVGAIVAELLGSNQGIGYTILLATYHLDTNMLFASIVAASLAGIIFFGIISFLEKKFLYWHESTTTI